MLRVKQLGRETKPIYYWPIYSNDTLYMYMYAHIVKVHKTILYNLSYYSPILTRCIRQTAVIIAGVGSKGKEGEKQKDSEGRKGNLIFLQERSRKPVVCWKDISEWGADGQLIFSVSATWTCLAPDVWLKSVIWESFRSVLNQENETYYGMWAETQLPSLPGPSRIRSTDSWTCWWGTGLALMSPCMCWGAELHHLYHHTPGQRHVMGFTKRECGAINHDLKC